MDVRAWMARTGRMGAPEAPAAQGGKRILHDLHEIGASGFMDRHWREDSRWLGRLREQQGEAFLSKSSMRQSAAEAVRMHDACRGKHLLATGDDECHVALYRYPALQGAQSRRYSAHASPVASVRFAAGGTLLSAGGDDATVLMWLVTKTPRTLVHAAIEDAPMEDTTAQGQQATGGGGRGRGRDVEDVGDSLLSVATAWDF